MPLVKPELILGDVSKVDLWKLVKHMIMTLQRRGVSEPFQPDFIPHLARSGSIKNGTPPADIHSSVFSVPRCHDLKTMEK